MYTYVTSNYVKVKISCIAISKQQGEMNKQFQSLDKFHKKICNKLLFLLENALKLNLEAL